MDVGELYRTNAGQETDSPDFEALFSAFPDLCVLLRPDDPAYTIVAVNAAFAQATLTDAAGIIGRGFFDVFPNGVENLRTSLQQVLATRAVHAMAVQTHVIRRPNDRGGQMQERYWKPVNTPILGRGGEVRFIFHRVEEVTESVRLGSQLAESQRLTGEREAAEARYRLAFAEAPIGMVLLTPDGQILEANQAYADMLGYTREELALRDSLAFAYPDDAPIARDFFAALREGRRRTCSIENRYLRRDGEILWVRAYGTLRRSDRGDRTQVIAAVEDITVRKSAEARYRFLAESIPQMVWTAAPNGMLEYLNGQGTAYFGASQEALLDAGWLDWVHPEEREQTMERWRLSLETGEPYETSFRLKRGSDHCWRWHLARAVPFKTENGSIVQWFGTCTDIEYQKQFEANLQQQWQTFDTALSHTPDFAYIFDLAGRFTYVNKALLTLWEITLEEARGKNFVDLDYPPDLAARLQRQIQSVIETKKPVRDQTPFTGPGGETGYYDYIFVPVLDSNGCVRAVAGSTRDITEQNRISQRIEEERRRWRQLLFQVPAGIAVLRGPEHRFEWVNAEYARLTGRAAEVLTGKTVAEVFPEIEGQAYMGLLDGVYRTGEPFVGHEALLRLQRGGGALEDLYVNFLSSATRDAAGAIDGIFVHVAEVTDVVRGRKRLEASEERFRAAVQANSSLLWTNNARGEMEGEQPGWGGFTGQTRDDYQGYGWAKAVHPEDAQATIDAWNLAVAERRTFVFEHRVRRAGGAWRLFSIRAVPVFDQEGGVREWVGVHNDITEERSLLNALRQSEARFRQTIDSMPQLVWSALPDGNPDLYNKQWFEYTGFSPGDEKNDQWTPVHSEDRPLVRERWQHSLRTGEPFEIELRYRRFDGQYRWFLARAAAIRDDEDGIVRWFGAGTDIEDRKKAELAVLTKQKLESLGLLAGGIAHDFNNLLVGVLGGASYAVDALPETHSLQPILRGIVAAGERAAHLTRQMLAYAGKGRFLIEPIDIGELVRSTCSLIKASIPKHVQVTLKILDALPAVEADSGQMQQIVMNLILNAAEAIDTTRTGTVAVRTSAANFDTVAISRLELVSGSLVPGSYLVFEVQDNGSGMDHETQTKIFDPFFTTKFTGRGLGLSAVQGILRTHNGALELNSRVEEGSTFRVFLPASGRTVLSAPLPRERAGSGAGTVLFVDDEEIVLQTGKASLERAGFKVLLAEGATEALRTLLDSGTPPIDLIVLDMSMPGTNGKDVLERIRQMGVEVPVLICSGYSEAEVYREFSGLDIAGFIPKPFTSLQLTARIRGALPGRSRS